MKKAGLISLTLFTFLLTGCVNGLLPPPPNKPATSEETPNTSQTSSEHFDELKIPATYKNAKNIFDNLKDWAPQGKLDNSSTVKTTNGSSVFYYSQSYIDEFDGTTYRSTRTQKKNSFNAGKPTSDDYTITEVSEFQVDKSVKYTHKKDYNLIYDDPEDDVSTLLKKEDGYYNISKYNLGDYNFELIKSNIENSAKHSLTMPMNSFFSSWVSPLFNGETLIPGFKLEITQYGKTSYCFESLYHINESGLSIEITYTIHLENNILKDMVFLKKYVEQNGAVQEEDMKINFTPSIDTIKTMDCSNFNKMSEDEFFNSDSFKTLTNRYYSTDKLYEIYRLDKVKDVQSCLSKIKDDYAKQPKTNVGLKTTTVYKEKTDLKSQDYKSINAKISYYQTIEEYDANHYFYNQKLAFINYQSNSHKSLTFEEAISSETAFYDETDCLMFFGEYYKNNIASNPLVVDAPDGKYYCVLNDSTEVKPNDFDKMVNYFTYDSIATLAIGALDKDPIKEIYYDKSSDIYYVNFDYNPNTFFGFKNGLIICSVMSSSAKDFRRNNTLYTDIYRCESYEPLQTPTKLDFGEEEVARMSHYQFKNTSIARNAVTE